MGKVGGREGGTEGGREGEKGGRKGGRDRVKEEGRERGTEEGKDHQLFVKSFNCMHLTSYPYLAVGKTLPLMMCSVVMAIAAMDEK